MSKIIKLPIGVVFYLAKKFFTSIICLTLSCFMCFAMQSSFVCSSASGYGIKEFFDNIFGKTEQQQEMPTVYLGGLPLGFTLNLEGAVVIAIGGVHTDQGVKNTIVAGNVEPGDIIKTIDGIKIQSAHDISQQLQMQHKENKIVTLQVVHDGSLTEAQILPAKDIITGEYKLGLWIRDNSAGVGTLTYMREDNLRFGALGHSVCDIDTNTKLPVADGTIYKCNIIGLSKSKKGTAGELKGLFLRGGTEFGKVDKNIENGVFGYASDKLKSMLSTKVKVAKKHQVKTGKASIFCALSGTEVKEYSIEIIKTAKQSKSANKSMVIRILDPELLNTTGGIVQGMSGSPIVQNGMLVGAVTHVFLSDPTKGYGVYAEWMINQ